VKHQIRYIFIAEYKRVLNFNYIPIYSIYSGWGVCALVELDEIPVFQTTFTHPILSEINDIFSIKESYSQAKYIIDHDISNNLDNDLFNSMVSSILAYNASINNTSTSLGDYNNRRSNLKRLIGTKLANEA